MRGSWPLKNEWGNFATRRCAPFLVACSIYSVLNLDRNWNCSWSTSFGTSSGPLCDNQIHKDTCPALKCARHFSCPSLYHLSWWPWAPLLATRRVLRDFSESGCLWRFSTAQGCWCTRTWLLLLSQQSCFFRIRIPVETTWEAVTSPFKRHPSKGLQNSGIKIALKIPSDGPR